MLEIIQSEPWMLIPLIAIAGGLLIALLSTLICTAQKILNTREYERSRREIAAYVAEGSISPDEGERLLNTRAKKS